TQEEFLQLPVELDGLLQQLVAQVLELRLLEQDILADSGVEGPDRLLRQVESFPLAIVGRPQLLVGACLHGQHDGEGDQSYQPRPPTARYQGAVSSRPSS